MSAERFPVEATHIMMFARAIGDENPAYMDPDSACAAELGGVLAPPTFVAASAQFDPAYALRPKAGEPWFGSAKEPTGAPVKREGRLHAEQHFEYHRPLLAGEMLRAEERPGASWEKESKRGGTLLFKEQFTDYVSVRGGDVVVTARSVTVVPSKLPASE